MLLANNKAIIKLILYLYVSANNFLVVIIIQSLADESKEHGVQVQVFDLSKDFDIIQHIFVRVDSNLLSCFCVLSFNRILFARDETRNIGVRSKFSENYLLKIHR